MDKRFKRYVLKLFGSMPSDVKQKFLLMLKYEPEKITQFISENIRELAIQFNFKCADLIVVISDDEVPIISQEFTEILIKRYSKELECLKPKAKRRKK